MYGFCIHFFTGPGFSFRLNAIRLIQSFYSLFSTRLDIAHFVSGELNVGPELSVLAHGNTSRT